MAQPAVAEPLESDMRALGAYAKVLAERLGETAVVPRQQLWRIVQAYGIAACEALAEEAEDVWTGKGMRTMDGNRERTLGGVFFALAKSRTTEAQRRILYPGWLIAEKRRARTGQTPQAPLVVPPLAEVAAAAQPMKGAIVSTVSLKLIGHPSNVQMRGSVAFFVLTSERVPSLPKEMPQLAPGTRFLVIVGEKQWKKVADTLRADPEARCMIEGCPTISKDFTGIVVEATACTILPKREAKTP